MIQRCTNPKSAAYPYYGGRGVVVCERWLTSFDQFYADMGERPDGMTIERRDCNGAYEPSNCKWASKFEQASNTRSRTIWRIDGVDYRNLRAASVALKVAVQTIQNWCAGYTNKKGEARPAKEGCSFERRQNRKF